MKKTLASVLQILMVLSFVACTSNSDENIEGDAQIGTKEIAATKATFTGETVTTDDSFNYLTFDLDVDNEESTYVKVENYNANYSYQLKLTGVYTENVYNVAVVLKTLAKKDVRLSSVVPSTPTQTLYFDLSSLDMKTDFYTAVLVEVDSGNELSLLNNSATDTRGFRFIDQGNSEFYTTIRASQTNGAITSTGHPIGYSIKLDTYVLTKAKAYIYSGETHQLAFYTVNDQTLVKKTATITTSNSSSVNGGTGYYTSFRFISPSNIGLLSGDYLVRMEVFKNGSGIIKTSPFQKFKVQ